MDAVQPHVGAVLNRSHTQPGNEGIFNHAARFYIALVPRCADVIHSSALGKLLIPAPRNGNPHDVSAQRRIVPRPAAAFVFAVSLEAPASTKIDDCTKGVR